MSKNKDIEINDNISENIEDNEAKNKKLKKEKKEKKKKEKAKKNENEEIKNEITEDSTEDNKEEKTKEAEVNPENKDEDITEESENNNSKKSKDKKSKKAEKKPEDVNIVKDLLWLIVYIGIVILICFCIIKFVGCRSRVDGSSMNPTLTDGDNLWVDKLSYTFGDPKRFDIIIFNPNGDENITYVKRIIGLPGETVSMDLDGKIYINGQLLNENYALKEAFFPTSIGILSGGNEIVLGDDEYFVLGDNRNNSMDSRRADPGNVKREYIVGKVVLRIYPFSKFGFVD